MDEVVWLRGLMDKKKRRIGDATTATELHGGETAIDDASLIFRGFVVTR